MVRYDQAVMECLVPDGMIEWEQDCLFTLNCPLFHASMSVWTAA